MKLPTHILVIRLSALGDVAMTVPVLIQVAKAYPDIKFTVLSKGQFKPLFENVDHIRFVEAEIYGRHKGFGLLKLASDLRALRIDAVADLHNVIRSKILRTTLSLKGVKSAVIDKGRKEKRALTRGVNKELRPLRSTHERYADVFRELGLVITLNTDIHLPARDLTPRLLHFIGTHTKKAIGIAPFAAYKSKMYPLEKMIEVIARLDESNNYQLFLFGGGTGEEAILGNWAKSYSTVRNVAGQLTFAEELALISNLDLMLSMDSSNGHLAAMYGIPVVTLWGVTHPYAGFTPYGQPASNSLLSDMETYPRIPTSVYGNKYPEDYEQAMDSIPVSAVVEKIESLLN